MEEIRKRPLAVGCGIYLIGIWALISYGSGLCLPIGIGSLGMLLVCLTAFRRARVICKWAAILLLPAVLACVVCFFAFDGPNDRLDQMLPMDEEASAVIRCEEVLTASSYAPTFLVRIESVGGEALGVRAVLHCEHELDFTPSDVIQMTIKHVDQRDGEVMREYAVHPVICSEKGEYRYLEFAKESVWQRARRSLCLRLTKNLDEESAGLVSAMLLGDRTGLSSDLPLLFRNLGLSHVLALSGLHLTLIFAFLGWCMRKISLPRPIRNLIILFGVALYAMLTGLSPSLLRAGGMLILVQLACLVRRRPDSITLLCLAVSVITTVSPFAILDIGLLLSAFATLGILVGMHRSENWEQSRAKRMLSSLKSAIGVTVFALCATLPISLTTFGTVSLMSIPANLILSLPITFCMVSGLILLLCSFVPILCSVFSPITQIACKIFLSIARWLDGGNSYLLAPSTAVLCGVLIAVVIALILVMLLLRKHRGKRFGICLLAVLLLYLGSQTELWILSKTTAVTFFSDGANDGILIHSSGQTVLCDYSSGYSSPAYWGREKALSIYRSASLSGYLISHYHTASLQTASKLLLRTRVETLFLPQPVGEEEEELCARLSESAIEKGCRLVYYTADGESEIVIGEVHLRLFRQDIRRSNHPALMMEIRTNGRRIGYFGACSAEAMPEQFDRILPYCDVVFFGSYGPKMKVPMQSCGEAIFASSEISRALGIDEGICLDGIEDDYTVKIK